MYSRVKKYNRRRFGLKVSAFALFATLLGISSTTSVNTASMLTLSEVKEENQVEIQPISVDLATVEQAEQAPEVNQEVLVQAESQSVATGNQVVPQQVNHVQPQVNGAYPTVLANGNTAGAIGSEAAAQMAAKTGVPQATWEYIIARESNGNPNAANASGASGLFQTMPGWGSTATVQDQINAAVNAYNNQGLAAWGM